MCSFPGVWTNFDSRFAAALDYNLFVVNIFQILTPHSVATNFASLALESQN